MKGNQEMVEKKTESFGERIKAIRSEKGLSIEELAQIAGCSAEFLEWVEEGQVKPPVALLLNLAKAMKLSSATFFDVYDSQAQRQEEAAKRTEHYSYKTLTPPEEDKHLMAFSITIPPKTAHEGVGYRHEGEEFVYVLSGEVDVTVGKEKTRLGKRESLRFNSSLDHHLSNPGEEESELLVILFVP